MSGNYIKLYRSFLEWEWWHDANTSRVFLYILLMANWTDKKWKGTIIKRGSFVSSFSKIALATSLSRKCMKQCEKLSKTAVMA